VSDPALLGAACQGGPTAASPTANNGRQSAAAVCSIENKAAAQQRHEHKHEQAYHDEGRSAGATVCYVKVKVRAYATRIRVQ